MPFDRWPSTPLRVMSGALCLWCVRQSLLTSEHPTSPRRASMSTRNIAIAALILVVLVILYFAFAG